MKVAPAVILAAIAVAGTIVSKVIREPVQRSPAEPPSMSYLQLLPDGPAKRSFILDCTGCHQLDASIAFPDGRARTEGQWRDAIERMLDRAGPRSGFPVIAEGRDPSATGRWLAAALAEAPAPRTAPAPPDFLTEYDYPYPRDLPHDLQVEEDGRVLITGMFTHRMLRLDPASGLYDEVEIPVRGANPRALELGAAGEWWVLLGSPRRLSRRSAAGHWDTFDIGVYGHSVGVDPSGRAWFNGHFTSSPPVLGYVDPESGNVRTYEVPLQPAPEVAQPIPYELRVGPGGSIWVTELRGNRLVRFDPNTGAFSAWLLPTTTSGPRRHDVSPDGTVWIPACAAGKLVRFDPATEQFSEYDLPLRDALPYVARVDARTGMVWIGTGAADALLSFDPATEVFQVYPLRTAGALVRHIDIDARTGDVWAAYGASPGIAPKIVRLRPSGHDRRPGNL